MFAIVEIAGLQYKVEKDQKLYVNKLAAKVGDKITFDKVLLTHNGSTTLGAPAIKDMAITAEVLDHVKGDKVLVFKKKRRKGYKVKNGHRQQFTQILITGIGAVEKPKKTSEKKETDEKAAKVKDEKEVKPKAVNEPKAKTEKKTTETPKSEE